MTATAKLLRVGLVLMALGAIGIAGHRLVVDKMVSSGYDSFWLFYLEKLAEPITGFTLDAKLAGYALGVTLIALLTEILILGWPNSSLRRLVKMEDQSTVNDTFYWIIGTLRLGGILRLFLTLGAASIITYSLGQLNFEIRLIDRIEMPVVQYVTAFLILDFLGYFQHRLAHSWGWWWELHKIHHSAEKFNMVTYYRTHVLESVPRAIIYGIALSITGDLTSFIFYYALLELISLFVHSEVQYKWGWLEKYLLVSPRNHKIHHSVDPRHHDKNFGFTLIIWDRMFGTWYAPRDGENIKIGLKGNPFNRANPVTDLLLAYRNCLRSLLRLIIGDSGPKTVLSAQESGSPLSGAEKFVTESVADQNEIDEESDSGPISHA